MIYTHAQVWAWGLRWGWPGLVLSDGTRLRPGRESYLEMDSEMLRLVSLKIARWNARCPSPELSELARVELLPDRIIRFERREQV